MVKTADVVAGADILTNWGNEIRDKTAQVFATAAERDAQWPAPADGALAYTSDLGTWWLRRAGAWVPTVGTGQPPYTGAGVATYTDAHGELWVAKSTVAGGAYRKARDVVAANRGSSAFLVPTSDAAITFDAANFDPLGLWVAGSAAFVLPVGGIYLVEAVLCAGNGGAANNLWFHIAHNNTPVRSRTTQPVAANMNTSFALASSVQCAAGDTIQIKVSAGYAINTYGGAPYTFAGIPYTGTG